MEESTLIYSAMMGNSSWMRERCSFNGGKSEEQTRTRVKKVREVRLEEDDRRSMEEEEREWE
jgi:hypothetical protein